MRIKTILHWGEIRKAAVVCILSTLSLVIVDVRDVFGLSHLGGSLFGFITGLCTVVFCNLYWDLYHFVIIKE